MFSKFVILNILNLKIKANFNIILFLKFENDPKTIDKTRW